MDNDSTQAEVCSNDQLAARYPLEIENVGEDTYIVMSRGHHDPHEFMRAVRESYSWPLGFPTHEWMRAIPAPKDSGYRCLYVEAKPHSRGSFPATYAREAWGEDRYEAKAANVEVTGLQRPERTDDEHTDLAGR